MTFITRDYLMHEELEDEPEEEWDMFVTWCWIAIAIFLLVFWLFIFWQLFRFFT